MNLAVHLKSLVFNESLDNPILGFNAVKVLVNNTSNENSLLINSIQSNVKNIKSNDIKALVNLISQSSDHDDFLVHSMPSTIVRTGKLINIQCKVNLVNSKNRIPMFFEKEEIELPEGLETADTIVPAESYMNHRLNFLSLAIQNMLYFYQKIPS